MDFRLIISIGYVLVKCCYVRNQLCSIHLSVASRFQRVGWVSRRRNPSKQQLSLILLDSSVLQNDGLRRWLTHPTIIIATLNRDIAIPIGITFMQVPKV